MVADDDRRSYFIAPNVGKEAIALNLKDPRGQELLVRLLRDLGADVFCCHTVPPRYPGPGIDPMTLRGALPKLIWAGISAMGPAWPEAPGYDPVIQAMAGFMEVTGNRDGPPMLAGIPIIDLKAGDESNLSVMLFAGRRGNPASGRTSMCRCSRQPSWLSKVLPLVDMHCRADEITGPVTSTANSFRATYIRRAMGSSIAIGSDIQWRRLTGIPKFASVANAVRETNQGRIAEREALHRDMAAVTAQFGADELLGDLRSATIPAARILDIRQVADLPQLSDKLLHTRLPDGTDVRMPPKAVDWPPARSSYAFPPKYGQHTRAVLGEAGLYDAEIEALLDAGVVADGGRSV
ncbi:MAG: CoA transferase [Rhodocyclaceae bacterium]|nr:CoA transferase [Rhodocyclaceae bacterium]